MLSNVIIDEDSLEAVLNKAKKQRIDTDKKSKYIKVGWIPCTTCEVERLFSMCKHIFSPFRKALLPETIEILLYLHANRELWDINTFGRAICCWEQEQRHNREQELAGLNEGYQFMQESDDEELVNEK